jgi:hypothetical protein
LKVTGAVQHNVECPHVVVFDQVPYGGAFEKGCSRAASLR